jgi:hypothetical protein
MAPPVDGSEKSGTAFPTVTGPRRVAVRPAVAVLLAVRAAGRPLLAALMI